MQMTFGEQRVNDESGRSDTSAVEAGGGLLWEEGQSAKVEDAYLMRIIKRQTAINRR